MKKILCLLGTVSLTASVPVPLMTMKNIKITAKEELRKVRKSIARKTASGTSRISITVPARAAIEEIEALRIRLEAVVRAAIPEMKVLRVRIKAIEEIKALRTRMRVTMKAAIEEMEASGMSTETALMTGLEITTRVAREERRVDELNTLVEKMTLI